MKIVLSIVFFTFINTAMASLMDEWTLFKAKHGKSYTNLTEESYRLSIYMTNKKIIEEHNRKYNAGKVKYFLKINQFGDKLPEEVYHQVNGFNKSGELNEEQNSLVFIPSAGFVLPYAVNWREKGAVTPVKDQGHCNSCWAFSSTGALEGQLFLKTGKLVSLSEQNLVDCTRTYGNEGCNGGFMDKAFMYIKDNGGIASEQSYPYEGIDDQCRYRNTLAAGSASGFVELPHGDEKSLMAATASVGPISVGINAGTSDFAFYGGGIYDNAECDPSSLNHGVLVVGYGSENGQDYWLIKNSWNTYWGEEGYVRIARNLGNLCGVASQASYPVV